MPNRENKRRDRLALRASTAYFLHSVDLMARVVGGDILRGVIFTAIVDANTRHIRPSAVEAQTYSEAGDQVPDTLRRPISVHALALELDIPYETTRRHVNALIADGRRVGAIGPAQRIGTDPADRHGQHAEHRQEADDLGRDPAVVENLHHGLRKGTDAAE
eukprot:gene28646-biopygen18329